MCETRARSLRFWCKQKIRKSTGDEGLRKDCHDGNADADVHWKGWRSIARARTDDGIRDSSMGADLLIVVFITYRTFGTLVTQQFDQALPTRGLTASRGHGRDFN